MANKTKNFVIKTVNLKRGNGHVTVATAVKRQKSRKWRMGYAARLSVSNI